MNFTTMTSVAPKMKTLGISKEEYIRQLEYQNLTKYGTQIQNFYVSEGICIEIDLVNPLQV